MEENLELSEVDPELICRLFQLINILLKHGGTVSIDELIQIVDSHAFAPLMRPDHQKLYNILEILEGAQMILNRNGNITLYGNWEDTSKNNEIIIRKLENVQRKRIEIMRKTKLLAYYRALLQRNQGQKMPEKAFKLPIIIIGRKKEKETQKSDNLRFYSPMDVLRQCEFSDEQLKEQLQESIKTDEANNFLLSKEELPYND